MEDWIPTLVHKWLEQHVPGGTLHGALVAGIDAVVKVVLALLLYFGVRWLALRTLHHVMVPLLARTTRRSEAHQARIRTLESLARKLLSYTIFLVIFITLMGQLGLNVSAILAGAGVFGLALSFGAQRLVRDLVTGVFLLTEDQFHLGEFVTIVGSPGLPSLTGTILDMGLRSTQIRDEAGRLVTIGNGDVAIVVNHSRGVTATVDVGIASDVPVERLNDVVAATQLQEKLFAGPAKVEGVFALEPGRMVVRISAPTREGAAPAAESALRRAVGTSLPQAGIALR